MEESFLKVESPGNNYYLRIMYDNNQNNLISLTAVDGVRAWYGEVSKADLEDQAKAAEREFDEFLMETRCALLLENPTSSRKQFSHSAELENGHLKFTWKLVLDHGIKFQLGTATLLENKEVNIGSYLDAMVCQFSKMKDKISTLSAAKKNLLNEREKALKRLEEFAVSKENLEEDLFGKFLAVLNEKKAKIRQLKQRCEDLKHGQAPAGDLSTRSKTNLSHESSEDEDDTDKEVEKQVQHNKAQSSMPEMLGADEEDDEEVTVAAKRKRKTKRKSDATASVLPRTVTLPRPLKKQNSGSTDLSSPLEKSYENLEKLVDNM